MDWTSIITALIAALVPTGGLTAIVTLRDKKTAAFLENVSRLNDEWKEIAEERKSRCAELKDALDRKDNKIDSQYAVMNELRMELDHLRTHKAILEMLKCEKTGCTERQPPFGQGSCIECTRKPEMSKK